MEVEAGKHGSEEGVAAPSTLLLAGPASQATQAPSPATVQNRKTGYSREAALNLR